MGDFVVIRTFGTNAYNKWIYGLSVNIGKRLNSVTTILFHSKISSDINGALTRLRNAEAIFIAGGDQSEYIKYWVGTEVQQIVQEKAKTVTVGGTSAGCMVLGHKIYPAIHGTITSAEALKNPFNSKLTIAPAFLNLPFLSTVILDTHFVTRNRMGR